MKAFTEWKHRILASQPRSVMYRVLRSCFFKIQILPYSIPQRCFNQHVSGWGSPSKQQWGCCCWKFVIVAALLQKGTKWASLQYQTNTLHLYLTPCLIRFNLMNATTITQKLVTKPRCWTAICLISFTDRPNHNSPQKYCNYQAVLAFTLKYSSWVAFLVKILLFLCEGCCCFETGTECNKSLANSAARAVQPCSAVHQNSDSKDSISISDISTTTPTQMLLAKRG